MKRHYSTTTTKKTNQVLTDGSGSNGLAVIWDSRTVGCMVSNTVYSDWKIGRQALGKEQWAQTLRIALRDAETLPLTAKQTQEAKPDVSRLLQRKKIKAVLLVQSPSLPNIRQTHSAWNLLGHGGNPYQWAGTVETIDGMAICPILTPFNYEYVYEWLIARWIRQAHAIARGTLEALKWPKEVIKPCPEMQDALTWWRFNNDPLAVDIETNMAGTIITAIGLSDGKRSISCPWDEYPISGSFGEREPAIESYADGSRYKRAITDILQCEGIPKILHNGTFDVLQLKKHAINLAGFRHDTLLMHRVVYPQYRHGLQQACATEFAVSPWKSLFKPPKVAQEQDPWLGEPRALRAYNSKDTFATWHLYDRLKKKVGE